MSSLRSKLSRLGSAGPARSGAGSLLPIDSPEGERPEAPGSDHPFGPDAPTSGLQPEALGSPACASPGTLPLLRPCKDGPLHVLERRWPAHHRHGRVTVSEVLSLQPNTVAHLALDESLKGIELGKMLLLDTETTGLAGGTGTLPFLIGLGWFEHGALRVEQLFLRKPGEEVPMLRLLAERMSQASCVVTYNGKSYDWPLLRTRFIMNRCAVPPLPVHLDLVHAARRLYRRRLQEVRLGHLESFVLGHQRQGDIPGSEIPERYFAYLRGAPAESLGPIFHHNAEDLAAVAASLVAMARLFECTEEEGQDALHAPDLLSAAQVAWRAGAHAALERLSKRLLDGSCGAHEQFEACALLARAAVMQRRMKEAAEHCHRAFTFGGPPPAVASLHHLLAKLYEHHLRDPRRALQHAQLGAAAEPAPLAQRRLSRLERRVRCLDARLPLFTGSA